MTIAPGAKLGPYEIEARLGAGGMGEVFRARDARLSRTVAIKVLASHLSATPELKERFDREARAISSLNHPHICTLHDIGHHEGTDFLVMEMLEGQTLAQRLAQGPIPLKEMLRIGAEICEALEAAHRSGIIHRDLKPGNVMLTKSGIKLMDFGLAKTVAAGAAAGSEGAPLLSATRNLTSPTISPLTTAGQVIGTIQYMSPEQLEGRDADHRSDIFAVGAVLYEMATGKRAFDGKSQLSIASAILEHEPEPISQIQPLAPAALQHVVQTCLAKDPEERCQSAHDVRLELQWIAASGPQLPLASTQLAHPRQPSRATLLTSAGLLLFVIAALIWSRVSQAPPHPMYFNAALPFAARGLAIAPNGHTVAVVGYREDLRKTSIFLHELGAREASPLAGTEGANFPFWSPDGNSIGFFADGKLKRIDLTGNSIRTLADAPSGRGGTWNKRGIVLFTPSGSLDEGLWTVPAEGGKPQPFSRPDHAKQENSYRWPLFLPDGKHFFYLAVNISGKPEQNAIFLGSLDNKDEKRMIVPSMSNAVYADGFLLFMREKALYAQRFDAGALTLQGDATRVLEDVRYQPRIFLASYAALNTTLVAQRSTGVALSRLTWFDRTGKEVGSVPTAETYANVALSPDDKWIATDKTEQTNQNTDVWIYDWQRGTNHRLTFDPAIDSLPVWSPDARQIAFTSSRLENFDIYVKPSDGSQSEEALERDERIDRYSCDWSRDGKYLLETHGNDLWLYSFAEKKSRPFISASAIKTAKFSPNGKWVAYSSNETGRWEIYVTSFPNANGKWQVSSNGGEQPVWRRDGGELFFMTPDAKLMATPTQTQSGFDAGSPVPLFQANPPEMVATTERMVYDVSRDGQRFLINSMLPHGEQQPMSVLLNWASHLK